MTKLQDWVSACMLAVVGLVLLCSFLIPYLIDLTPMFGSFVTAGAMMGVVIIILIVVLIRAVINSGMSR